MIMADPHGVIAEALAPEWSGGVIAGVSGVIQDERGMFDAIGTNESLEDVDIGYGDVPGPDGEIGGVHVLEGVQNGVDHRPLAAGYAKNAHAGLDRADILGGSAERFDGLGIGFTFQGMNPLELVRAGGPSGVVI